MKIEIKTTNDGSQTLYVPELDEHYHSYHGAIQEAKHVFLANGLDAVQSDEISVLEIGWGTGLNALLTALWSMEHQKKIRYTGLEAYPVPVEMNLMLNYPQLVKEKDSQLLFETMVRAEWEAFVQIHPLFDLKKQCAFLQKWEHDSLFDIVFYDAFGPRAQSEMWEIEVVEKVIHALKPQGIFVTYCAKGQLKRDLKALGCEVESLPGPPGKREMVRARKI